MLHFLNPEEFDDVEEFKAEYGDLKTKEQVDKLQASLRPYMLRYPSPLHVVFHIRLSSGAQSNNNNNQSTQEDEGGRRQNDSAQGGDHRGGGAHFDAEEVLPRHPRQEPRVLVPRRQVQLQPATAGAAQRLLFLVVSFVLCPDRSFRLRRPIF